MLLGLNAVVSTGAHALALAVAVAHSGGGDDGDDGGDGGHFVLAAVQRLILSAILTAAVGVVQWRAGIVEASALLRGLGTQSGGGSVDVGCENKRGGKGARDPEESARSSSSGLLELTCLSDHRDRLETPIGDDSGSLSPRRSSSVASVITIPGLHEAEAKARRREQRRKVRRQREEDMQGQKNVTRPRDTSGSFDDASDATRRGARRYSDGVDAEVGYGEISDGDDTLTDDDNRTMDT